MKKRYQLMITLFCMVSITACTNTKETEMSSVPPILQPIESSEVITTQETETVPVSLYYGNNTADGLVTEEIMVEELTAERLIQELSKKNIVSLDTKVRGFQIVEKGEDIILDLNLSKEFAQYVGMMGTAGEYIIMAGLTNTFLDAFDGTSLVLNCNGMPLETGHHVYSEPLTKYALNNTDIEKTYELTQAKEEDEVFQVAYPQFVGMEDTVFMTKWNAIIKEQAMGDYKTEGLTSYVVEYEIATQDVDFVSIVLRGSCQYENAAYPFRFAKTLNIDLKSGDNQRLASYADIDAIVKKIKEGNGFQVLSDQLTPSEIQKYMQNEYLEDFSILLFDYDYDSNNKSLIPTGYSYKKENKTVLVINVIHAMGDYVEIQMEQ